MLISPEHLLFLRLRIPTEADQDSGLIPITIPN